jgi:hypothetical protein
VKLRMNVAEQRGVDSEGSGTTRLGLDIPNAELRLMLKIFGMRREEAAERQGPPSDLWTTFPTLGLLRDQDANPGNDPDSIVTLVLSEGRTIAATVTPSVYSANASQPWVSQSLTNPFGSSNSSAAKSWAI